MAEYQSEAERAGWDATPENITEPFRRLYSLLNSMGIHGRNFALAIPELAVAADAAVRAEAAILAEAKKAEEELQKAQLAADVTAKEKGDKTVKELMDEDLRERMTNDVQETIDDSR